MDTKAALLHSAQKFDFPLISLFLKTYTSLYVAITFNMLTSC